MEQDIELAKKYLKEKRLSFVIVKNGIIIAQSRESGIKDLLKFTWLYKDEVQNAVIADKLIGKAASVIIINAKIRSVFANTISRDGLDTLHKNKIHCTFENKIDKILNHNKDDICSFEKLVKDIDDIGKAYLMIKEKLDVQN